MKERSNLRIAMQRTMQIPDERSLGVYKLINEIYPAFAEKIFQGNKLMKGLIMSGMNPMDIMEYPICGKCETFAAYTDPIVKDGKYVHSCACVRKGCGAVTPNPVQFREWIMYELKRKTDYSTLARLDIVVDRIAMNMALTAQAELMREMQMAREQQAKQMNTMSNEYDLAPNKINTKIEHNGNIVPDMPGDIEIIKEDEDNV